MAMLLFTERTLFVFPKSSVPFTTRAPMLALVSSVTVCPLAIHTFSKVLLGKWLSGVVKPSQPTSHIVISLQLPDALLHILSAPEGQVPCPKRQMKEKKTTKTKQPIFLLIFPPSLIYNFSHSY